MTSPRSAAPRNVVRGLDTLSHTGPESAPAEEGKTLGDGVLGEGAAAGEVEPGFRMKGPEAGQVPGPASAVASMGRDPLLMIRSTALGALAHAYLAAYQIGLWAKGPHGPRTRVCLSSPTPALQGTRPAWGPCGAKTLSNEPPEAPGPGRRESPGRQPLFSPVLSSCCACSRSRRAERKARGRERR